jgi:alkaline phosphatase D
MNQGDAKSGFYVSRREFLKYSFSAGVVIWAGSQVPRGMSEAEAQTLFTVSRVNPAVFPQSVASGDPQPNGIILWTRIAALDAGTTVAFQIARDTSFRAPVFQGTAQTSAGADNVVKMQINDARLSPFTTYYYRFIYNGNASRTGRFKTLPAATANVPRVRFGYISCQDYTNGFYTALAFLAEEDVDFIVHLGDYIYETVDESSFQGGQVRQITFPSDASNTDTAGTEAAEKNPDFDNDGEADTLADYRFLYKTYKADRNLQRLHERFAFITIWDDHEFANDCYQEFAPDADGTAPSEDAAGGVNSNPDNPRRSAANQAWVEYTPVGALPANASPDSGVRYQPDVEDPTEEIGIYRTFVFGNLLELVMLDERLYRDGPPNGLDTQDRLLTPGTRVDGEGEEALGRTMLGNGTPGADGRPRPNQFKYFTDKIRNSTRRWKIMGNETMFMQFKLANTYLDALLNGQTPPTPVPGVPGIDEGVYLNLDQWDGYQAERSAIAQAVKGVRNFVIITGDLHTFIAGYVRENYDAPTLPGQPPADAVGVCFMGGSVTSSNLTEIATLGQGSRVPGPGPAGSVAFTAQAQASNPHFEFLDSSTHGYNVIEVTPTQLTCTMRAVSTISSPQATLSTLRTFTVPDGQIVING